MKKESSDSGTSVLDETKRNQTLIEGEKSEFANSKNTPRKKQTSGNKRQDRAGSHT